MEYTICNTIAIQQQPRQVIVHCAAGILQTVATLDVAALCGLALCTMAASQNMS